MTTILIERAFSGDKNMIFFLKKGVVMKWGITFLFCPRNIEMLSDICPLQLYHDHRPVECLTGVDESYPNMLLHYYDSLYCFFNFTSSNVEGTWHSTQCLS